MPHVAGSVANLVALTFGEPRVYRIIKSMKREFESLDNPEARQERYTFPSQHSEHAGPR